MEEADTESTPMRPPRTESPEVDWEQAFSPRPHISPTRPNRAGPKSAYSAQKKPELIYHTNRPRSRKPDQIIQEIPIKPLKYQEKIKYWKSNEKRDIFWEQEECKTHATCSRRAIDKFFGGKEGTERFRKDFSRTEVDIQFLHFQSWCVWPHRKNVRILKYYDDNGDLLPDRRYRYPRIVEYHINGKNGSLVLCSKGLQYLMGRGWKLCGNWTARVYRAREAGNFFPQYSNKKHRKEEKLVTIVGNFLEDNYEIRKSHYVRNLVKSGNLSLRSKGGGKITHYTQIYRKLLSEKDPDAWKFIKYQQNLKRLKRSGKDDIIDAVPEKKPFLSLRHFYRIMKDRLKIKIKEPVKDRCPICADINAQKSRSNNADDIAHYENLLMWHLKQKRSQKSLLRAVENAVEPYD